MSAQTVAAFNRAADEVAASLPDTDGRDLVVDLVINVGLYYSDHPEATLAEAIEASYPSEEFADAQAVLDSMPHPETREELYARLVDNVRRASPNGNG